MTYREASDRIEEHTEIHYRDEYPHAELITEALYMAVALLREKAATEDSPCREMAEVTLTNGHK